MPPPYAAYSQLLSPSSPSHAVAARLTSSVGSSPYPSSRGTLQSHLVTARDDTLQVWEVRAGADASSKLWHLKTKTFFGAITGLHATKTIESETDTRDRILLSFKDAKISLLEWNEQGANFETISIHTYERTSQLVGFIVVVTIVDSLTFAAHFIPPITFSSSGPRRSLVACLLIFAQFSRSTQRTAAQRYFCLRMLWLSSLLHYPRISTCWMNMNMTISMETPLLAILSRAHPPQTAARRDDYRILHHSFYRSVRLTRTFATSET